MHAIGLKSSWRSDQMRVRFERRPPVIEIHLDDGELESRWHEIVAVLSDLRASGTKTTVHQPYRFRGMPVGLAYDDTQLYDNCVACWDRMRELCLLGCASAFVAHPFMFLPHDYEIDCHERLVANLLHAKEFWPFLYLENDGEVNFSMPADIDWVLERTDPGLKLCLDIAHLFMAVRDNSLIRAWLPKVADRIGYLHVSDSDGHTDGLGIGNGYIDFSVLHLLPPRPGVIEVRSDDETDPREMLGSWDRYRSLVDVTSTSRGVSDGD